MCKCFKEATGSCCTKHILVVFLVHSYCCSQFPFYLLQIWIKCVYTKHLAWWANKTDGAGLGINPNLFICYAVNKCSLQLIRAIIQLLHLWKKINYGGIIIVVVVVVAWRGLWSRSTTWSGPWPFLEHKVGEKKSGIKFIGCLQCLWFYWMSLKMR